MTKVLAVNESNNNNTLLTIDILGNDSSGQDIIPISDKLEIKTNRHRNTDGTEWGWIEGCSKHICWSDTNEKFNRAKAHELVQLYNNR